MNLRYIPLLVLLAIFGFASCQTSTIPVGFSSDPPQYGTPFANIPATQDIVMYEINTPAFSATGNFAGITARLDSIKALGINTIWLMPIYPVGILKSFGSPYCVREYTGVNASLGTLADLRQLVSEAHKRNIAVILDWVANHTSWDNPWIANKSWYTQDAQGNIISPPGTNWTDVADLNYGNKDMRLAMIKAMKYWTLTANIDGFRCDAADYVPFDFWQQAIDTLSNMKGRKFILLAEGARADHFAAGFQMNYAWDFLSSMKSVFIEGNPASGIFATNLAEYVNVPAGDEKLRFTTNHDESNLATPMQLFNGKQGALAASVVAIFLQGAPLIYCGQEVGVSATATYSTQKPIDWTKNIDMEHTYRQMLSLYNSSKALRVGVLQTYDDQDIVSFTKTYGNETWWIIVNTRNRQITYNLPDAFANTIHTNAMDNSTLNMGTSITLQAYQYYLLK